MQKMCLARTIKITVFTGRKVTFCTFLHIVHTSWDEFKSQYSINPEKVKQLCFKQVTWGHNFIVVGWAGASNPHLQPNPDSHKKKHTQKECKTLILPLFNSITTDQWTDHRLDKASYRVACPPLKIWLDENACK